MKIAMLLEEMRMQRNNVIICLLIIMIIMIPPPPPKNTEKRRRELEICGRTEIIQTKALVRSAEVLKNRGDLLSLVHQRGPPTKVKTHKE